MEWYALILPDTCWYSVSASRWCQIRVAMPLNDAPPVPVWAQVVGDARLRGGLLSPPVPVPNLCRLPSPKVEGHTVGPPPRRSTHIRQRWSSGVSLHRRRGLP